MKHKLSQKGFTLLELLVVLAIMMILIGLVLIGLVRARAHARDEERVTSVQTIALALQQYHDVCRVYPNELRFNATCDALAPAKLGSFISNIDSYNVNEPTSRYGYIPLAYDGSTTDICSGYHLYVRLENDRAGAAAGARFDATTVPTCPHTTGDQIDASADPLIFDIRK